jgi:ABC-2 type transport system ATP-binding protein
MYENQRGVRHMDFFMDRGEIVGFLGPNGAGKTTTMRMITGYLNPTKGQIRIDGLSMEEHPKKARRKIGYLPETPPLYPEMSVMAYLKFIADLRDIPVREQKKRISEAVGKLGLDGREKQIIRSLSKGYRQRLGLAQAILHQPDLLVLDEPTSGLDPKQIIEIRELIKELGENHTVLLSTHILPEVNTLCNRVLIINKGEIVLDGNPEELGSRMNQQFQVALEVRGEPELIVSGLEALPGVETVKLLGVSAAVARAEDTTAGITVVQPAAGDVFMAEAIKPESDEGMKKALSISGETEAAEKEHGLADPAGVPDQGIAAAAEPPAVKLLVSARGKEDIREEVFFRLAELRLPILEMKKENLSLEDIFLQLTGNDPDGAGVSIITTEPDVSATGNGKGKGLETVPESGHTPETQTGKDGGNHA